MKKVYVAGYVEDKIWKPLSHKGKAFPEEVKCRESVLEGRTLTVLKGNLRLHADDYVYAKSARRAKQKYIEIFEQDARSHDQNADQVSEESIEKEQALPVKETLHAVAYTDGSFNQAINRYGFGVLLDVNGKEYEFFGGNQDTTGGRQVNGEIEGVLYAVKKAIEIGCVSIEIRYDYEGIHAWADGLWKTNKDYTAEYRRRVQECRKYIEVSFKHVKAHNGHAGNERADKLAKIGAGLNDLVEIHGQLLMTKDTSLI